MNVVPTLSDSRLFGWWSWKLISSATVPPASVLYLVVLCHVTKPRRWLGDWNLSEYWHKSRPTEDVTVLLLLFFFFWFLCALWKVPPPPPPHETTSMTTGCWWVGFGPICRQRESAACYRCLISGGIDESIDCVEAAVMEGFAARVLIKCIRVS